MFRHVVLFRWVPDSSPEARAAVSAGLAALPDQIAEIRAYRFGPDAGINAGNFDFGVVADFDDRDAYLTYRDHPAHQQLIAEHIAPIVAERAALQYEIEV